MQIMKCLSLVLSVLLAAKVHCQNDPRCRDLDSNCESWARNEICRTHSLMMREICPQSCNFCNQIPQDFKTITTPEFDCGLPYATKSGNTSNRVARQTPSQRQRGSPGSNNGNVNPPRAQDGVQVQDTFCGASVIHPRFILTAAHCVLDPKHVVRSVRLGELDFSRENETNSRPVDYAIERIIVHPYFDPNLVERYNDVALLQTKVPIEFNELVYPFCLSPERPAPKSVVTASGFGKVNETHQSPVLQEAELNVIDSSDCEASYRQRNLDGLLRNWYPSFLQGTDVLCAGHPLRGACEGDGGGPLFKNNRDGRRFLVGVISTAMSCQAGEAPQLPGIYTSIADHIDFIDSVIYG